MRDTSDENYLKIHATPPCSEEAISIVRFLNDSKTIQSWSKNYHCDDELI